MKNFIVFFLLAQSAGGFAQNYLNDGGFEIPKDEIDLSSSCHEIPNLRVVACEINTDIDAQSINSSCPGGYGAIHFKTKFWTDRGDFTLQAGQCSFCEPHLADWLYQNPANHTIDFSGENLQAPGILPYEGRGCAGMQLSEMVQQQLRKKIATDGFYIISGEMIKDFQNKGNRPYYDIHFMLSQNQPHYLDETCEGWQSNTPGYSMVTHFSPVDDVDSYIRVEPTDNRIKNWQHFELGVRVMNQNLNWFSVNVDGTDNNQNEVFMPYFAFDNLYIDDQTCYCPPYLLIQNENIHPIKLFKAKRYIRAGYDVGLYNIPLGDVKINSGSGKVTFRAGDFISLEPGFQIMPGAVFDTELRSCYEDIGPMNFALPDAYSPNCDGINDQFCFLVQNASSYQIDIFNRWGQLISALSGQIAEGQNTVCLDIPLDVPGENTYTYVLSLFGCQDRILNQPGAFTTLDATEGCYPSKRVSLVKQESTYVNISKGFDWNIYPNPACDQIAIRSQGGNIGTVVITNIQGELVFSTIVAESTKVLDVHNLSDGPYLISVINHIGKFTKKINKACVGY